MVLLHFARALTSHGSRGPLEICMNFSKLSRASLLAMTSPVLCHTSCYRTKCLETCGEDGEDGEDNRPDGNCIIEWRNSYPIAVLGRPLSATLCRADAKRAEYSTFSPHAILSVQEPRIKIRKRRHPSISLTKIGCTKPCMMSLYFCPTTPITVPAQNLAQREELTT